MEECEEVLLRFNLEGTDLYLLRIEEAIYLISPNSPRLTKAPLELPKIGQYDTSTPSSTYDTRGEIKLELGQPNIMANEAVIDITITETYEYWTYGSSGDDWHPTDPAITRKRLIIRKELDKIDYKLENIS